MLCASTFSNSSLIEEATKCLIVSCIIEINTFHQDVLTCQSALTSTTFRCVITREEIRVPTDVLHQKSIHLPVVTDPNNKCANTRDYSYCRTISVASRSACCLVLISAALPNVTSRHKASSPSTAFLHITDATTHQPLR